VGVHRRISEAKDVHRNDSQTAEGKDFEKMHTRTRHPIHGFCRVMHGMKSPQPWHLVESAVDPVLDQVGQKHDRYELHEEWQGGDPTAHAGQRRERKDGFCRKESEKGKDLDHQAAHQVIKDVFAPFRAKDFLVSLSRENALQRDEKKTSEQYVQNEKIESQKNRSRASRYSSRRRPSNQPGEKNDGGADSN